MNNFFKIKIKKYKIQNIELNIKEKKKKLEYEAIKEAIK